MIDLSLFDDKIQALRDRWKVENMCLFGSAVRNELRPDSDIDVMVSISPDADWDLFELVRMQSELEEVLDRPVDLVERIAVEQNENKYFRDEILNTAEPLLAVS